MTKNQLPTVTVGIPAYNEEGNIKSMLLSLLQQKRSHFRLVKIVVISDCSTDGTKKSVLSVKHPIIKFIEGTSRRGKYARVNQLFRMCQSDILIILDADIALVGDNFLNELVNSLWSDPQAVLVAAHQSMLRPQNFIGKIIHTNFLMWDFVRLSIPGRSSAHNYFGAATAYRGSFIRLVHIPKSLTDPHLYIYLRAQQLNGFRYCTTAQILSWPVSTISDLEKFLRRSIGKRDKKLEKIFNTSLEEVYFIPRRYKLIGFCKSFINQPFYTPLAILLSLVINRKAKNIKADKTPVWEIVESTKKQIKYGELS